MFNIRFQSSTHRKQTRRRCCLAKDKLQIPTVTLLQKKRREKCTFVVAPLRSRAYSTGCTFRYYATRSRKTIILRLSGVRNVIPEFESISMREWHCRIGYNDTFTYARRTTVASWRHVVERHANGTRCDGESCGWNRRTERSLTFGTIDVEESTWLSSQPEMSYSRVLTRTPRVGYVSGFI